MRILLSQSECCEVNKLFQRKDETLLYLCIWGRFYTNSYYKSCLSKEQLEVMVVELKKKVKNLQQRHRLHVDKLVDLENTVSHLRQSNLLNEERLELLERVSRSGRHPQARAFDGGVNPLLTLSLLPSVSQAYMQTDVPVSDAEETVTIIYEEDDGSYLYAPLNEEM